MANNQPFSSVPVIPSDTLNIPQPGIITSGTNATVGTTLQLLLLMIYIKEI